MSSSSARLRTALGQPSPGRPSVSPLSSALAAHLAGGQELVGDCLMGMGTGEERRRRRRYCMAQVQAGQLMGEGAAHAPGKL